MFSSLNRKKLVDSDEPKKRYRQVSVALYTSIKAWVLRHYEVSEGSFASHEDILMCSVRDKENIIVSEEDTITCKLLTRAVLEVLGPDGVKASKKRVCKKRLNGFLNLREKKPHADVDVRNGAFLEKWSFLKENIVSITAEQNFWKSAIGNDTLSCILVKNVRYGGQRVIIEIAFTPNYAKTEIETKLLYHQRAVPNTYLEKVLGKHLLGLEIIEKARFLMSFLANCSVCNGFKTAVDNEVYSSQEQIMHIVEDQATGLMEERFFAPDCQVFTNSGGRCCSTCYMLKKVANDKFKRRQSEVKVADQRCNHRYMSREQLVCKIAVERSRRLKAEKLQQKLANEMIEMEEADHLDLQGIINAVDKDDVPEEMSLLWDQQIRMLKSSSKSQYRWHPR